MEDGRSERFHMGGGGRDLFHVMLTDEFRVALALSA